MNDSKNSNKHQLTVIKDLNPIRHKNDVMDDFYDQTWIIVSIISLAIYFISLYMGWSWNNYFSISMLVGVHFYFWISRQPEILVLTENSITYKFLFYKKNIYPKEFKYQASRFEISRRNYKMIRLLIFKDGKKYIRVNDEKWEDAYLKIAAFASQHYPQNNQLQKPYLSLKRNGLNHIIGSYISIVLIIFGIGLFTENSKISYVDEMKLMGFPITQTPEVVTHKKKK